MGWFKKLAKVVGGVITTVYPPARALSATGLFGKDLQNVALMRSGTTPAVVAAASTNPAVAVASGMLPSSLPRAPQDFAIPGGGSGDMCYYGTPHRWVRTPPYRPTMAPTQFAQPRAQGYLPAYAAPARPAYPTAYPTAYPASRGSPGMTASMGYAGFSPYRAASAVSSRYQPALPSPYEQAPAAYPSRTRAMDVSRSHRGYPAPGAPVAYY